MAFPFSLTYNSAVGIPISDTFDQWRLKTVAIGTDLTNVYNNLNTLYGDFVTLSGVQTITGAKTFTATPKIQATTATLTFSEGSGTDSTLYRPTTIGGLRTDGILNIGGSSIFTPGGTPTAVLPTTTIQGNLTHSAGYIASFNSPATFNFPAIFNGTLSITGNTALTNLLNMSGSGAISGGAINNTTIGATTASTGRFSNLTATGAVTFTSGTINGTTIGASSSAAGTFSTLTSPSVTLTGGTINSTTIGATTATTGRFTTATATTAFVGPGAIAQRAFASIKVASSVDWKTLGGTITGNPTAAQMNQVADLKITNFTPKSSTSKIKVRVYGRFHSNYGSGIDAILAVFTVATPGVPSSTIPDTGALLATGLSNNTNSDIPVNLEYEFNASLLTAPTDFYVYVAKGSNNGTITFNRQTLVNFTYTGGGGIASWIEVTEYYQ